MKKITLKEDKKGEIPTYQVYVNNLPVFITPHVDENAAKAVAFDEALKAQMTDTIALSYISH